MSTVHSISKSCHLQLWLQQLVQHLLEEAPGVADHRDQVLQQAGGEAGEGPGEVLVAGALVSLGLEQRGHLVAGAAAVAEEVVVRGNGPHAAQPQGPHRAPRRHFVNS